MNRNGILFVLLLSISLGGLAQFLDQLPVPGHARGVDLLPAAEFSFPVGSRANHVSNSLALGAFQ